MTKNYVFSNYIDRLRNAKASDYIEGFEKLQPGDRVVLCCRVSACHPGSKQVRNKNLDDQEANLRRAVESKGAIGVGVVKHKGSGIDSYWLGYAVHLAKTLDAILLAESTDRFTRTSIYHSNDKPDAQAGLHEFENLEYSTRGVRLMTHLVPDASPSEVRSYQRKRGRKEKGQYGGRPEKRLRGPYGPRPNGSELTKVRSFHKHCYSTRQIARLCHRPQSTIRGWLKR